MRTHYAGASKKYYITGAPQCPFPDRAMDAMLNAASFDAIFVRLCFPCSVVPADLPPQIQFYNNNCGVSSYNTNTFNYGTWDYWAKTRSPTKNVKVFLGVPGSATGGGGYVSAAQVNTISSSLRKKYPSFGGVMYWDASQAYNNGRFDQSVKNSLVAGGGTGFTYPACSAPAYVAGSSYTAGSQVSYAG